MSDFPIVSAVYSDTLIDIEKKYVLAGTVTGRFSSSNPNLQNIPKRMGDFSIMFVEKRRVPAGKAVCPVCKRFLKKKGLQDHVKAAHGG